MGELGYHLKPVPICGDNQGSIFITSNPVTEKWSKHIDIHYRYIREVVEQKFTEIFFIDGDKNPADLLIVEDWQRDSLRQLVQGQIQHPKSKGKDSAYSSVDRKELRRQQSDCGELLYRMGS